MGKPLDKLTKVELIEMVKNLQVSIYETSSALGQRNADITRLKADLEALENRRRFEAQAYRAKIRENTDVRERSAGRMEAQRINGETAAQRLIREHREGARTV